MRIAVLEDDAGEADLFSRTLSAEGHSCTLVGSVAAMLSLLRRATFDLLLLDWTLPDGSGLEVVEWVRKTLTPPPPMLMVTARADEADVVLALRAGVDDYVIKPSSKAVIGARVEALLRRAYRDGAEEGPERYGVHTFDPRRKLAAVRGAPAALTAKEFDLALVLFRNANRALSRSYIADLVWGWNAALDSRTLDIHVSRVRAKLGLRPENGVRLAPVYGYGYRLEMATADEARTA